MLTLSIQAGGQSSRMGRNKALLPFLGQPLIQRVMGRLAHLADEIIITANHPENYHFLGVPVVTDVMPGLGALGGLLTALKTAQQPFVALVACDLPFANPQLLRACRDLLLESGADAVVPSSEYGLEPLHAVYRREPCLPLVESALLAGKRKLIAWHDHARVIILPPATVSQYDPHQLAFWNVNTPEEFHQAETKALEFLQAPKS
jgi:molybdopterin-guanine dinucleotide biosynthesis protein A